MKTELIEYHRAEAVYRGELMEREDNGHFKAFGFHSRAVAWLESLPVAPVDDAVDALRKANKWDKP